MTNQTGHVACRNNGENERLIADIFTTLHNNSRRIYSRFQNSFRYARMEMNVAYTCKCMKSASYG